MTCRLTLLLIAAIGFSTGCVRSHARASAPRTVLAVDNQGFADMTMYVVTSGQRIRLGLAVGKTTSEFTIPASVVGSGREIQFLADPVGSSRTQVTEQMYVRSGERVSLVIPP